MKKNTKKGSSISKNINVTKGKIFSVARARELRSLGRHKGLLDGKICFLLLDGIAESLSLNHGVLKAQILLPTKFHNEAAHMEMTCADMYHMPR